MISSFKKIIRYGLPYRKYAFLNIFFNTLYALFSALSFIALIPMLNVLFETTEKIVQPPSYEGILKLLSYAKNLLNYHISQRLEENVGQTLILVVGLVILLFFLKNLSNYLALYFITNLRNGILKDLRNALYHKIIELPVAYFTAKKKGDLMARMTTDVSEIQFSFLSILELLVREPLTILFSLLAMFFISVKLSLFVLLFIPLSGIVISSLGKRLKKHSARIQEEQGDFLSIIDETISGQKIIKTFAAGSHFTRRFEAATARFHHFSNKLLHRASLAGPASEFLGIAAIGILLWFGGQMVLIQGEISGATFIVYMGLAYNILTPAKAISKASYSIKKGNAAAERILDILAAEDSLKDLPTATSIDAFQKEIAFKKVFFSYEDQPIINGIDFTIKKGETVALVGPSGSGKTTLTHLLNRFYDIQSGSITIDGIPLHTFTKASLYQLIGMVTQESILFNDTVWNNIKLGNPKASEAEIIAAAQAAFAHDFIEALEEGYQTRIGDSGNKLSGGQKQRLTIARALLKDPQILILDEATSALDTTAEQWVQQALEKLMENRTSLVIAHRLSTIQKADKILVIDQGNIVESGNHNTLMQLNGTYAKLVQLQQIQ